MSDIIERGDVEEVQDNGVSGEKWYIPHHGIYHPTKPEKLRVVFDCSAKHKGTSLNEHLLSGPDMINNLTGVFVRFQQHPIALMCDIEKMFHQFKAQKRDRNYLRFLWWNNATMKQIERALGIYWNIKRDCFTFNITMKDQPPSRRGILSTVASIYDPLGFVAPYILSGKRILQEMCHHGTG